MGPFAYSKTQKTIVEKSEKDTAQTKTEKLAKYLINLA